ncbi:MAG TPA: AprI/Inh family metalloprotease inhibitor, partial [Methylobacterium sp.]
DRVPNYLLVRAKAGVDRAPHAPAIFGTWTMRRPDGPALCTVVFRDRPPPGAEESFALTLDPACDPAVRRLRLASWRIEDFRLMLYGEAGSLRFEPAPGGFDKAEGGRPLRLVRQP